MSKICIDPGHSNKTVGAVGQLGIKECDIVLTVGLRVGYHLQRHGVEVVYTRKDGSHKELDERVKIANNANVDYFASIHLNAADKKAQGTETYCYKFGAQGEKLAHNIQVELVQALGRKDRGVKEGNLQVIRDTKMPAVLMETVFIDNLEEEQFIIQKANQEKAAIAIAKGILKMVGIQWQDEAPQKFLVYGSKEEHFGPYLIEQYAQNKCNMLKQEGYKDIYYIKPDGTKVPLK